MASPTLSTNQTEATRASAGRGAGDNSLIETWLETALELAANFPPNQLSIDGARQDRATAFLNEVRGELAARGPDIAQYFDTSRPRYEYTLALALQQGRGRVLDVGCSPGHLAMALVKAGFDVQGIDLNSLWLEKYVPGWPERLRIRHTNLEQDPLPFPDRSFDMVTFTEVLEHIAIKDPRDVLADICRVLRPGGRLLLSTPNVANLSNVVALVQGENVFWPPEMFYRSLDRHNREYTPSEVLQLVERSGFAHYELGYMNTWSNWNHKTARLFHQVLDGSARGRRFAGHPLFNNTICVVATR